MATIKSYTDIEQSRKLAEILPLESADMFHFIHEVDTVGFGYKKDAQEFYSKTEFEYIPCWSLAALLGILTENKICHYENRYYCQHISEGGEFPYYSTAEYDNPVDACVEMIFQLKENELI